MVLTESQVREKLKTYAPLVQKYDSPISVATRLAQLIVESQMFTSALALKSNNGFGIKASPPWTGDSVPHVSGEVGGARESEFRKYPSHEASIKDHAEFFTSTEFRQSDTAYGLAIKATNYKDEAKYLAPKFEGDQYSYAGDPNYASKLIDKVERYNLTQYDKKESANMAKLRTPIKRHTQVNMGGTINKIEYIVIHFVGASGQALANANYFYNVLRNASAQIFIDPNVTYEVVPENRVAWHVGDGLGKYGITNQNSIGIEGCQDTSTGKNVWEWQFHPNTYEQMLLQTSAWMDKYNVPINKVVRHYDASRKSCPGNWMANDWAKWHKFKKDLAELRKTGSINVGGSTESSRYNPQGFQEVAIAAYRKPTKEFKTLFTNSDATPREVFNWYNPETKRYMISPNAPKYAGVKDKVEQIMDVDIGYSKKAYLLKNAKTWILEQDLKEPRADWESGLTASTYVVVKGDYLYKIAEQFNTTVEDLKKWNKLESNLIFTGMELFVVEPYDYLPEDEKPTSTDDSDNDAKDETVEDKGAETPAVELAENEVMDAKGNIFIRSEGWVLTPKE